MEVINSKAPLRAGVELRFSWTPVAEPFSYTIGSTVYVPGDFRTPTKTPIAFTASVTYPVVEGDPLYTVEHRWDFGDGIIGYGATASHTFKVANPHTRATLKITDSRGNHHFASHPLHLIDASLSLATLGRPLVIFDEGLVFDGDSAFFI